MLLKASPPVCCAMSNMNPAQLSCSILCRVCVACASELKGAEQEYQCSVQYCDFCFQKHPIRHSSGIYIGMPYGLNTARLSPDLHFRLAGQWSHYSSNHCTAVNKCCNECRRATLFASYSSVKTEDWPSLTMWGTHWQCLNAQNNVPANATSAVLL